ncbi:P-loop NTPase [Candidatus Woesearchaeota archaeon]|jgi:septum site-determining protein MinD|nr:P-loop NTPase [Candidatus Woesearchaeota archaeon]
MTEFIAVISAKGGVGKTTSSINLALALNHFGANTLLVDCDFTSANVGTSLGVPPAVKNLQGAMNSCYPITEAIHTHSSGLEVIPGSISYEDIKNMEYENLQSLFYNLKGPDHVIVDCPPGLGDEVIKIMLAVDAVIIITTPDLIAVTDTLKTLHMIKDIKRKLYGVVINKKTDQDYEMSLDNIKQFLETKILGAIPEDKHFLTSLYYKNPFVFAFPDRDGSLEFKKIAADILGKTYKGNIPLDSKDIDTTHLY